MRIGLMIWLGHEDGTNARPEVGPREGNDNEIAHYRSLEVH
jgi:hypothetical protein